MNATLSPERPTVLVIHDDGDTLDLLTRLFEAGGFDVVTAVAGFRAQAHLEGDRRIDIVVAPWDVARPVGGEVYQWALQRRYNLRDQFVFVSSDVPSNFDAVVAGRCLAVPLNRPAEIVRIAAAAARRRQEIEATHAAVIDHGAAPRLLLVDDEPMLLVVMSEFLTQAGYAVTRADSGRSAIGLLEQVEFDVMVVDWQMASGTGAEVYRWLASRRPQCVDRVVFLSGGESDDASSVAPGRPMFRKGQDSHALLAVLDEIVRSVRIAEFA